MKSIEKLRELAADINSTEIIAHIDVGSRFVIHTEWLDSWHKAFDAACDRIEAEIAERYMELPVDVDGVPLRYEDYVESTEDVLRRKWHVVGYSLCGVECLLETDDEECERIEAIRASWLRHVKPRTIEDVLKDLCIEADERYGEDCRAELIAKAADEIRGLL